MRTLDDSSVTGDETGPAWVLHSGVRDFRKVLKMGWDPEGFLYYQYDGVSPWDRSGRVGYGGSEREGRVLGWEGRGVSCPSHARRPPEEKVPTRPSGTSGMGWRGSCLMPSPKPVATLPSRPEVRDPYHLDRSPGTVGPQPPTPFAPARTGSRRVPTEGGVSTYVGTLVPPRDCGGLGVGAGRVHPRGPGRPLRDQRRGEG